MGEGVQWREEERERDGEGGERKRERERKTVSASAQRANGRRPRPRRRDDAPIVARFEDTRHVGLRACADETDDELRHVVLRRGDRGRGTPQWAVRRELALALDLDLVGEASAAPSRRFEVCDAEEAARRVDVDDVIFALRVEVGEGVANVHDRTRGEAETAQLDRFAEVRDGDCGGSASGVRRDRASQFGGEAAPPPLPGARRRRDEATQFFHRGAFASSEMAGRRRCA